MIRITNITDSPKQRHTLITPVGDCVMELTYRPAVQSWFFDLTWNDKTIQGYRIAAGLPLIMGANWPFAFFCLESGGVDPYRMDDFKTGRCQLYFITPETTALLRGTEVQG